MNRPWMPLFTRDWLDNKELRRCDPFTRSLLIDLMCIAHEGSPYGHLSDQIGALTDEYMASRCFVPLPKFKRAMKELRDHERIHEKEGVLYIKRMVEDEDLRLRRAAGGKLSIGHPHTHPPNKPCEENEGYPSPHPSDNPSQKIDSRAQARAESESESECISFPKRSSAKVEAEEWFHQEFWPLYPLHKAKKDALQAALKLTTPQDRTAALDGLRSQLPELLRVRARDPSKLPHPATWLNARRWEDEVVDQPSMYGHFWQAGQEDLPGHMNPGLLTD